MPAIENDVSISGTNSFGQLMSEALAEEEDRQESNNGFNVFSVEVTDNTVMAKYEILETCTMLAAIYDEEGELLITSGKTEVMPEEDYAEVTIETDNMPQYFYLRIFLVDSETLSPLCTAYESPNYTQEMQEFFAKTTDDFDEERVLNLDSDNTNNFAVFSENVKTIEGDGTVNNFTTVDIENQYYVIENADSSVTSLKTGEIFTYESETNEQLIVKVGTISVSNSTVTITRGDTSTGEVFEYIKIDTTEKNSVHKPQALPEPFESQNKKLSGELSATGEIEVDFEKDLAEFNDDGGVKLKGGIKFTLTGALKYYLTHEYKYLELGLDYSAEIGVSVEASFKKVIPLGKPIVVPIIAGVKVEVTPSFRVELEASISLTGTLQGRLGWAMDSEGNGYNLTERPEFKTQVEVQSKFFIGFALEPAINLQIFNFKFAKASLTAVLGAEIESSSAFPLDNKEYHKCSSCLDREIYGKLELSLEASLLPDKKQQSTTTTAANSQNSTSTQTTVASTAGNTPPASTTTSDIKANIIFDRVILSLELVLIDV